MLRLTLRKTQCFNLQNVTRCVHAATATVQDVKPYSEVPKIPEVPILGAGWNYIKFIGKYNILKMHKGSMDKYLQYGPIIREKMNKDFSVLHVYEYEDMEKVYRHEGRYPDRRSLAIITAFRSSRPDLFKDGGLFNSNGPAWQEIRSHVQPYMMKPKAIHTYLGAMDAAAMSFLDRILYLRPGNGGEVAGTLDELYKWSLESIGLVALDTRLGCLEIKPNEEAARLITSLGEIFYQMLKLEFGIFPLWKYCSTPMYRKFMSNMTFFSDTTRKYLQQAQDRLQTVSADHEATFLEMMLSEKKDFKNVMSTVMDMFAAGVDTTSTTVGLTLYHLTRNPEAQEKAYQEIKSVLAGKELTASTMSELRYLKACVKESMRLTPVVLGNGRITVEDLVLAGYQVPAGTMVIMENMIAGLLEKNYPEPHRFLPERFLRGEKVHHPFAFLPFSFGPRSCVGRRIAEQEIWTVLIRILERFRVEYHHEDIDLVTRLINTPDKPLRFQYFDR